ncbi:MAG TPA: SDR family oxidoreductase [Candidatus Dormibacteraeota bacterium]|nr:SDR family oxidoreductase [Candidatus Dormibacteraeota bacterium]
MGADGRVAVVTGAGSGIGAAVLAGLAREGLRVAALDLDAARAEQTARAAGPEHAAFGVDVANEDAVREVFEAIVGRMGRIDALATCAGIVDATPFMEATAATFRRVHEVNAVGTFLCMREAARRMTAGGRICTVASVAGLRGGGLLGTAAYSASKGSVLALSKNAARALADRGIAVNCVAPGATQTRMTAQAFGDEGNRRALESAIPMHRVGTPEEIAEGIVWLLSPGSAYVNGETLVVDGGLMMR